MKNNQELTQFNFLQIILLHLVPGVPILLIGIILGNPNWGLGLPFMLAIFSAIPFGLIPGEILIMSMIAKKENNHDLVYIKPYENFTFTFQC